MNRYSRVRILAKSPASNAILLTRSTIVWTSSPTRTCRRCRRSPTLRIASTALRNPTHNLRHNIYAIPTRHRQAMRQPSADVIICSISFNLISISRLAALIMSRKVLTGLQSHARWPASPSQENGACCWQPRSIVAESRFRAVAACSPWAIGCFRPIFTVRVLDRWPG